MLDLLAAIVSADPPSILAWLILAFAAAGYPLGIMLGSSCSPCCNQSPPQPPCGQCTEGELPDTITVTFDDLQDRTPGPDLCLLTFSAPYGSGATGKVLAPGGDPATDKGPISSVSLTSGGSGYAKLGRVAPTITASGGSGTGATFSVSITSANDANGIPSWSVTGVTWTGSTSNYIDGDQIDFGLVGGSTAEQSAAATIRTVITAPTLTASVSGGTGAVLSVTTGSNSATQRWFVAGITVTNGGTGYPDSGYVAINTAIGDTTEQSADAMFYCGRVAPTVTASVNSSGSGAVLSVSLASATGWGGRPYWYVSGISVTSGGTGYAEFDQVSVSVTDGDGYGAYAEVSSVDEDGAITGIAVYWGGEYFKSNGIIESVELVYGGGLYYRDAGEIASISLEAGGKYYLEDPDEDPYVATVTVGVDQTAPSNGSGATFTATVNSDTSSADFGKITSVTVSSGGNNYLAWEWKNTKCCGDFYNGLSVVLKRLNYGNADPCLYQHRLCGVGNISGAAGRVALQYNGPTTPPTIGLFSEWRPGESTQFTSSICNTTFTASGNVTNCSDWSGVSFSASGGATASVTAGGEYDATFRNPGGRSCFICCKGDEPVPAEVEIDITSPNANAPGQGVYVRPVIGFISGPSNLIWGNYFSGSQLGVAAEMRLCASQTSGGFSPSSDCGDNCHKKCSVVVDFLPNGVFGTRYWTSNYPLGVGQDCECKNTPLCNPFGSYTLCNSGNPSDCPYTVTINAPL